MKKNENAVALWRLAKGKRKKYSAEELKRRRDQLAAARLKRWPKK